MTQEQVFDLWDTIKEDNEWAELIPLTISKGKKTFGYCQYNRIFKCVEKIAISKYVLDYGTDDEILNILLHELAHAKVYHDEPNSNHGHDYVWRDACRDLGAEPSRLTNPSDRLKQALQNASKYVLVCPNHGVVAHRERRPRATYLCRQCDEELKVKKQHVV